MGLHWDMDKNPGWHSSPQKKVAETATIERKGMKITLEKIEYFLGEEKLPLRTEYALVLPSGKKLYSRSERETLASLISPEDAEYLEALVRKGLLVKRFKAPISGITGYRLA